MPQLDLIIYLYQYILLLVVFFLLYDLILNFWLPGFLNGLYLLDRIMFLVKCMFFILVNISRALKLSRKTWHVVRFFR